MVPFRSCTAGNCISCRQKNCGKCRVCSIKYARKRNPRVYRIDFFESASSCNDIRFSLTYFDEDPP